MKFVTETSFRAGGKYYRDANSLVKEAYAYVKGNVLTVTIRSRIERVKTPTAIFFMKDFWCIEFDIVHEDDYNEYRTRITLEAENEDESFFIISLGNPLIKRDCCKMTFKFFPCSDDDGNVVAVLAEE